MRTVRIMTGLLLCLSGAVAVAQSSIETVLESIGKNNRTIATATLYWQAKQLEYRTGNAPDDPTIGFDFMAGSVGAGNQTEVVVAQSFDFPTVYAKRKQLADRKVAQSEFHLLAVKQGILLEAKKRCLKLIYHRKMQRQLSQRQQNTGQLLEDLRKRADGGNGNLLDVNKAILQLLDVKKQIAENDVSIAHLNTKLTELNGGKSITFSDTIYPLFPMMPTFEEIELELENNDPVREVFEQEEKISQKQLELSKGLWFPKLEAGFRHVSGMGQSFNGVHTGISVPLWANRNTVRMQKATLQYARVNVGQHRNGHFYETQQLYDRYLLLKESKQEYETALGSLNSRTLLKKALEVGHLSTIEYFMEVNYFEKAFIGYLQTEAEYYQVVAELLRYR